LEKLKPGDIVVVYSLDGLPVTNPCLLVKVIRKSDKHWDHTYHTLTNGKLEIWESSFWRVKKHESR
jgi:DNA invertase Pin-like site-specific DNA recombinase